MDRPPLLILEEEFADSDDRVKLFYVFTGDEDGLPGFARIVIEKDGVPALAFSPPVVGLTYFDHPDEMKAEADAHLDNVRLWITRTSGPRVEFVIKRFGLREIVLPPGFDFDRWRLGGSLETEDYETAPSP